MSRQGPRDQEFTDGAAHVRGVPGPQTQGRNRDLEAVTTRQKVEWQANSNITELTIYCAIPSKTITIPVTTGAADNGVMIASTDASNYSQLFVFVGAATTATGVDFSWSNNGSAWWDGEDAVAAGAHAEVAIAGKYFKMLQNTAGDAYASVEAQLNDDIPVYGMLAIDAGSDAIADALLTQLDSTDTDSGYIPIPLNTVVKIPLTDALAAGTYSGGRVDVKSSDTSIALDFWIGGN